MAALLAELVVSIVRSLIADWLGQAVLAGCAWVETRIRGRRAKLVVGGLLGLAAFILIPVLAGLLGL